MPARTMVDENTIPGGTTQTPSHRWLIVLVWSAILLLCILAIGMRLYNLGLPFERDYDEGVYWQSLRAMSAGNTLYGQTFYSQPPFFLGSLYPFFVLFGATLWSARFGVALISLSGIAGAFLLGKALHGRQGALVAVALTVVSPVFLLESRVLQADAPSTALSLLAVGLTFMWWKQPAGRAGLGWITLAGITLALGLLSKLFVASIIPIALLVLARAWQVWQKRPGTSPRSLLPIVAGLAACVVTALLVLLPFLGSFQSMFQGVISFHTTAASVFASTRTENLSTIGRTLFSLLALAALYGIVVALLRGDGRVLPLVAWLLGTIALLFEQVPLLAHHLVVLTPPLVALAVLAVGDVPAFDSLKQYKFWVINAIKLLGLALILVTVLFAAVQDYQYYMQDSSHGSSIALEMQAAADLRNAITSRQQVVTDEQFVAGLANRDVPPALVDTSTVRIKSGYLTLQQLIAASSQPQVHAILFFSGRFGLPPLRGYHTWVAAHFHLLQNYGNGQELWVR